MPVNISPAIFQQLADGGNKASQMTDDQLKNTLNDPNATQFAKQGALNELTQRLGAKVANGTATEDEKKEYNLLKTVQSGNASNKDLESLSTLTGVSVTSLSTLMHGTNLKVNDGDIK